MKIDIDRLSEQQRTNLRDALKAYEEKKVISSASPPVLYIELTQNCNGRCYFCHGETWRNDPRYNMSQENFGVLLRDYIPHAVLVDLRGWGESLMLPDFDRYVACVAGLGPSLRLTTNLGCGTPQALQSIIDHDVFISLSIDAADKDVFERIRKGVSFDVVMKNLEFLTSSMLKKHGSLEGRFRFGVAPLQVQNLEQLTKLIELARRFRVPEVRILPLVGNPDDPQLLRHEKEQTLRALDEAVKLSRRTGVRLQLGAAPFEELKMKDHAFDRCCHPWLYANIKYDGRVTFCDHLVTVEEDVLLGYLNQPKDEIWNGALARIIRKRHLKKDLHDLPFKCRKCYAEGRYADHEADICQRFSKWQVTENEIEEKMADRGNGFFKKFFGQ